MACITQEQVSSSQPVIVHAMPLVPSAAYLFHKSFGNALMQSSDLTCETDVDTDDTWGALSCTLCTTA